MSTTTVYVKGRNAAATARILDALTRSGLLSDRITWEEVGDILRLTIKDLTGKDKQAFIEKKDYTVT